MWYLESSAHSLIQSTVMAAGEASRCWSSVFSFSSRILAPSVILSDGHLCNHGVSLSLGPCLLVTAAEGLPPFHLICEFGSFFVLLFDPHFSQL